MKRKTLLTTALVTLSLAIVGVSAISAQNKDKYSVTVPGGLAFSEFRGYESWQTISISHGSAMAVMLTGVVVAVGLTYLWLQQRRQPGVRLGIRPGDPG